MPRPNWFFGFPIDGEFVRDLPELPKNFRLFHPEDVHATLAFLGGCGESSAMRALDALDARLRESVPKAIPVSLAEVVPMGARGRRYTALSALLDRGRAETTACLLEYRDLLTETAGGRRDERAPKPHVTIARPRRRATDADREAGLEWARRLDLRHVQPTLDRIALYTWPEPRRERLFQIVAERRLA